MRHKSYTLRTKLDCIERFKATNLSGRQFAAQEKIDEATLREWVKKEPTYRAHIKSSRVIRRIRQRVGMFPQLEKALSEWITLRNEKGIRVKDEFIRQQARKIRDDLLPAMDDGPRKNAFTKFSASTIWCSRFKRRNGFVSRRHTTTHTLPENFRDEAIAFVESVRAIIREKNIKRHHIINMDQVPRYFECDTSTTITKKGSKEVRLSRSSTSHKRFTFTPFVTASGKFLLKHALFSKRTNKPKVNDHFETDANSTGMWSKDILVLSIDKAIAKARNTMEKAAKSPLLFILDSYGVHLKFLRIHEADYKAKNVYFKVVPPRLTGLLQPLDVGINRSFQQFFDDRSSEYQNEALSSTSREMKTPRGNVKMPTAEKVTNWAEAWCLHFSSHNIAKAFDACGLVPDTDFSVDKLHKPLQEIYNRGLSMEAWRDAYKDFIDRPSVDFGGDDITSSGQHALVKAIYGSVKPKQESGVWIESFKTQLIEVLEKDLLLKELFTGGDKDVILRGDRFTEGYFEVYAIAQVLKVEVHFILLDDDGIPVSRMIFGKEFEDVFPIVAQEAFATVTIPENYQPDQLTFEEVAVDVDGEKSDDGSDHEDDFLDETGSGFHNDFDSDDLVEEIQFDENGNEIDDGSFAYVEETHLDDKGEEMQVSVNEEEQETEVAVASGGRRIVIEEVNYDENGNVLLEEIEYDESGVETKSKFIVDNI